MPGLLILIHYAGPARAACGADVGSGRGLPPRMAQGQTEGRRDLGRLSPLSRATAPVFIRA